MLNKDIHRKLSIFIILVLLIGIVLAGCGSKESGGKTETVYLTFASGSVGGGAYYPLGGGIADILSELDGGVQCTSEATGASIENGRLVASGESQLGFMMGDAAHKAVNGIEPFEKNLPPLKALFNMYTAPEHIVTLKGSGIKTIEDLKGGKKVSVDAPGSGCEVMAKEILKVHDITYDDFKVANLSQTEAGEALKDGNIDALFWNFAYPGGAVVMDVTSVRDIEMIPVTGGNMLDKLVDEFSYYVKDIIPAGTYKGVDEDIPVLAVGNVVVVNDNMDEELAYKITKILFENIERLAEGHPAANQMNPEMGAKTPIDLHPGGAERYFKEIGILK